ncbi:MAG: DNA polymerase III subunit gamma/tau [Gammaproteobacteria bacterium]|nr:DNA polymerase III subunit gamma/tau [Gammaproteobacteria bacterium]
MTYQVLARKWRPKSFSDMAGQEHVLQTLIHALDNNRLHHAYLFTGTRGVGKTTIARIFAKCLNCEMGITSTPCGKCSACLEIAEGRFIDLIEVDAASKTKVEDTRELLENVQYAPSRGRYKVYLIDEVHMLSTHSFNALLKTLEEPPPHIVFLLATTDPHKLPITILSRCLQFSLKNLSPQKIVDYLRSVLIAEQIPFEEGALWHLAKGAQGSMRDALTLLDQSISFCAGNVREAEVSELLGTPDQTLLIRIIEALKGENASGLLDCASSIAERSFDYFIFLENLLSLLHRLAIAQLVPGGVDNSQGDREQVLALARELKSEDIQLYYQIALNGRQDLANAHDPRMALEMLLLRMLVFSPQPPVDTALLMQVDTHSPIQTAETPAISAERLTPEAADSEKKKTELKAKDSDPAPAPVKVTPIEDSACLTPQSWIALVDELAITGITGNLLANCIPESQNESSLALILDESQSSLFNDEHLRRITQCLSGYFGREMLVRISIGQLDTESPARFRQRMQEERIQKTVKNFENDENVQAIVQQFSAHIQQDSISVANEVK